VIVPGCAPLLVEASAAGGEFAATLLVRPLCADPSVVAVAVGEVSPDELEVVSDVAASVALGLPPETVEVDAPASVPL
jgi:hypothetical protein